MSVELLNPDAPRVAEAPFCVRCVAGDAQFAELEHDWDRLAAGLPFRRWAWSECWWKHYRDRRSELCVLVVADADGQVRGIAPWYTSRNPWLGRVIRFLGSGEVCSEHLTILAAREDMPAVVEAVADWLMGPSSVRWDTLALDGIDESNAAIHLLIRSLEKRRAVTHQRNSLNAWRIELPATWDDYLRQLSRTRRERVKQLFRRKFDTGEAVVHVAVDDESLARGWEVLETLHQRRWESQGEPGCFASPRFAAFHREIARRMLADGQLRLQWIELAGRPIAVEYSFADHDTVYYYQSGIEPDAADERPGWMGVSASIRRAIEAGQTGFDFLRGDEAYKASWRAAPRELAEHHVFAPHTSGRWRRRLWLTGRAARQLLNRGRARLRAMFAAAPVSEGFSSQDG